MTGQWHELPPQPGKPRLCLLDHKHTSACPPWGLEDEVTHRARSANGFEVLIAWVAGFLVMTSVLAPWTIPVLLLSLGAVLGFLYLFP